MTAMVEFIPNYFQVKDFYEKPSSKDETNSVEPVVRPEIENGSLPNYRVTDASFPYHCKDDNNHVLEKLYFRIDELSSGDFFK